MGIFKETLRRVGSKFGSKSDFEDFDFGHRVGDRIYSGGRSAIIGSLQRSRDFCKTEENISIQMNLPIDKTRSLISEMVEKNQVVKKRKEVNGLEIDIVCISDRFKKQYFPPQK